MKARATVGSAIALTLLLSSCVQSGSGSDPGNPDQVEAVTSWSTASDRAGLDALQGVFAEQYPDLEFIDASVAGGDGVAAQHALDARFEASNPPDTFLTAGGSSLELYAAADRLRDLGAFVDDEGLRGDAFRAGLLDRLAVDGVTYALPAAVHRVNVVWVNVPILRAAGIEPTSPPTNVEEWTDTLETVRQSGVAYPLALGGDRASSLLFESVLLADLGDWRYRELWVEPAAWENELISTAIDQYGRLLDYVDPLSASDTWQDSAQRVVDGKSAFLVSSDVAVSVFDAAGLLYGREYSTFPVPGTKGVFDFAASSFAIPVGAAHQDAATDWLRTITSKAGQVGLALAAGSIPARSDIDPNAFGRYQQTAISSLAADSIVSSFAFGLAGRPAWVTEVSDALDRYSTDRKPTALRNRLIAAAKDALTDTE